MKKTVLAAALLVISGFIIAADFKPFTYEECVKLALQNNPAYKMQAEKLKQANLARLSSIGSMLPTITLNHSRNSGDDLTKVLDANWQSSLDASMPVFTGFSQLTGILQSDRKAAMEDFNLKATEQQVKEEVAAAFYALAAAQSELIITQEALDLMKAREKELKTREALGKSRLSELYSVQSSVASYEAQLETVKNNVEKAVDAMSEAAGIEAPAIIQPVETEGSVDKTDIKKISESLPAIKAVDAEIEAQGRAILKQEGIYLPDVGLLLSKELGAKPYAGDGLTFYVTANWTLFDGGTRVLGTMTGFSEEERLKQKRLQLLREKENEVKGRFRNYETSVKRLAALKTAYEKSSKSFKLIEKDYRMGMATNIEVIQSMTDMINVKKALDNEVIAKEKNKVLIEILK